MVPLALAGRGGSAAGRGTASVRGAGRSNRGGRSGGGRGRGGGGSSSSSSGSSSSRGGGRGRGRGGRGGGRGGASSSSSSSKYHGPAAHLLEAADARAAANAVEAARRARALDDRAQRDLSLEVSRAVAAVAAGGSASAGLLLPPPRSVSSLVPFEVAAASLDLGEGGPSLSSSSSYSVSPRQTRSRGARKDADRLYLSAHRAAFGAALDAEQREEAAATQARLKNWPRARLAAEGCALFGLSPAPDGALFGDVIVRLSVPGGKSLPFHVFAPGDNVLLSQGDEAAVGGAGGFGGGDNDDGDGDDVLSNHGGSEGILLEYSRQWIRVALAPGAARTVLPERRGGGRGETPASSGGSGGRGGGLFRLDLFGNSTAHDRCLAALDSFAAPPAATGEDAASATLRRALMGLSRGGISAAAAATAPSWAGGSKRSERQRAALRSALFDLASPRYSLNESQVVAGRAALTRTLTLWQGPPGTGKTRALAALVDVAARSRVFAGGSRGGGGEGGRGGGGSSGSDTEASSSSSRPILVCAASNVAVDNTILALLKLQERGGGGGGGGAGERGASDGDASTADEDSSSESRHHHHHHLHHRQLPALRIVRLGPPAKASPAVRHLSLAALAAATPAGRAAAAARADAASQPPGALGRASRERAAQLEEEARRQVLARAHVVAATTVAAGDEETFGIGREGGGASSSSSFFPFVAIDEATQATEPSALVPLILRRACAALLVGDPRQLPPTVVSREASAGGLGVSLFERLSRSRRAAGGEGGEGDEGGEDENASSSIRPFLLDTQYRMHPALSQFPSWRWYGGRLRDGVGEAQREPPRGVEWPPDARRARRGRGSRSSDNPAAGSSSSAAPPPPLLPVLFVPCDSPEQRCGFGSSSSSSSSSSSERGSGDDASDPPPWARTGTTFRNDGEAAAVLSALSRLLAAGDVAPSEVGIITPYAGQARALRAALDGSSGSGSGSGDLIEVKTVDGFQGREKEVVIFSAVRSNERGAVGFLADGRRLNVALTRAKRGLIVVGNPRTLQSDGDWREWLKWWRQASGGGGG